MKPFFVGLLLTSFSAMGAAVTDHNQKAISVAQILYELNIGSASAVQFSVSNLDCSGDETIQTCVADVSVKEAQPRPGGLSYKVTFTNDQIHEVEQICKFCW